MLINLQSIQCRQICDPTRRINILTPINKGGPYNWGRDLANSLITRGYFAKHTYKLTELLASPLYQKADIIHTTVPLAYRLWEHPVVFTVHGDWSMENNIWKLLYPIAIRKANIITSSHFLAERLNLENSIVIPNAVFPEQFKTINHTYKEIVNLVTVTNLYFKDKANGILDILRVLNNLPKEARNRIHYSVVGGGPYLSQLTQETRRFKLNIQLCGELPNSREALQNSDIFIYYSHHDNFPIAILEAMACGLPVVTNNVGAVTEMIEDKKDGFVANDDDSYSQCLLNLISSPTLRARIGNESRKTIETKFNWKNIVDQYIGIYNQLL